MSTWAPTPPDLWARQAAMHLFVLAKPPVVRRSGVCNLIMLSVIGNTDVCPLSLHNTFKLPLCCPPPGWVQPGQIKLNQATDAPCPHQRRESLLLNTLRACVCVCPHTRLNSNTKSFLTCDPFFRHPVSYEPHYQAPSLDFSQLLFLFPPFFCTALAVDGNPFNAHLLIVIAIRSSLVMRANWKWINEVVTGKRIHVSPCPFLMEALPLLEIDPWLFHVARVSSRETYNIARIKKSLLLCKNGALRAETF